MRPDPIGLTEHARKRCQQRGIPPAVIEWLAAYGSEDRTRGAVRRFFDHKAKKRLAQAIGHQVVDRLGDLLNLYVVMSDDDVVITAAHRTKRSKHN